jgi:hypothetical protein
MWAGGLRSFPSLPPQPPFIYNLRLHIQTPPPLLHSSLTDAEGAVVYLTSRKCPYWFLWASHYFVFPPSLNSEKLRSYGRAMIATSNATWSWCISIIHLNWNSSPGSLTSRTCSERINKTRYESLLHSFALNLSIDRCLELSCYFFHMEAVVGITLKHNPSTEIPL